jgi:hypothetical protein
VLAERVGWTGSASWFRKRVALLRPEYAPKDPADRLQYRPGDQAQCDLWFPPARIPVGGDQSCALPVLVVVASFSRCVAARMVPSRTTPDLLAGIWSLLAEQLGAVPRRLVWDNEAGIGRGGRLADGVAGFSGTLATRIVQLKPFDPESKGIVERANGYLETSFLPGRQFASPADFNQQLREWLPIANRRLVRSLGARPIDRLEADRAAMLPLPPVAPTLGHRSRVRLGRDYYVRVAGNDYSVDPNHDRHDGGDHRRAGGGDSHRWRPSWGSAPTGLGEQVDHHRPGPCRDRGQAPRRVRPACFDLSR